MAYWKSSLSISIEIFVLIVVIATVSRAEEEEVASNIPSELLGKKLLSYSTLVSILKARNNASRPGLGLLSQNPGKPQGPQQLMNAQLQVMPSPVLASLVPTMLGVGASAPVAKKLCSPASQEKNNAEVSRMCAGHRKGDPENAPNSKCMERYCVTIIPESEGEDEDTIENVFGNDVVAYTECSAVKNLFKILEKSAVTPKCYDCGS